MDIRTAPIGSIDLEMLDDFLDLRLIESFRHDYKVALDNSSFARTVAAFANTQGGVILIGIAQNRESGEPSDVPGVWGVANGLRERIASIIYGNIRPTVRHDVPVCLRLPGAADAARLRPVRRNSKNPSESGSAAYNEWW